MMPARPILALLSVPLLACGGCCSLARLFCGPDKSPWVPVAYDTPRATLATFLEAIRRDNAREVYFCLSRGYREAHGLTTEVSATVAWEHLQQQIPHLHLLGTVPVPDRPLEVQDGGVTYAFDLQGRQLRVYLVRQTFWEIRYRTRDGTPKEVGQTLDPTLNGHVRIEPAGCDSEGFPRSLLRLEKPIEFVHSPDQQVPLEQFDRLVIGREWKIGDLVLPD